MQTEITTRFVKVSKIKPGDLPVTKSTLYYWHHIKRNPEIFTKFGGGLFVDLQKLKEKMEKGALGDASQ